jgi:tubulin monoglycylase TTLL3/8
MMDLDLNVWLIEVNMSPSMEYSTPITAELCKDVLTEIPRVVLDA